MYLRVLAPGVHWRRKPAFLGLTSHCREECAKKQKTEIMIDGTGKRTGGYEGETPGGATLLRSKGRLELCQAKGWGDLGCWRH